MKKKLLLATIGAMSIFTLAACSNTEKQEIATMKGGKITVEDFYDEVKANSASQASVRNMIIFKVFEDKYGKDIDKKAVQEKYDEQVKSFGDEETFEQQLAAAGLTKESFKESLKNDLALEKGLEAHIKITDEDLKNAWEQFHPEVEAQVIVVDSEDEAKEVEKAVKEKDADFSKIAEEKSIDEDTKKDGGKIKFDSDTQDVPAEVKDAAFKLKDGEISEPVAVTNMSTYMQQYYIIRMDKASDKGNDMNKYKKEVEELAKKLKLTDQAFVTKVIGEELKEANVKIKDNSFDNILADFIDAADDKDNDKSDKSE